MGFSNYQKYLYFIAVYIAPDKIETQFFMLLQLCFPSSKPRMTLHLSYIGIIDSGSEWYRYKPLFLPLFFFFPPPQPKKFIQKKTVFSKKE